MKIVFFGPSFDRTQSGHSWRILHTLLEGIVDRGHHVVYFEPGGEGPGNTFPLSKLVHYASWDEARLAVEGESDEASALLVCSGFPEGHAAVDWLLDLPVPAHVYYELDPWETLNAFDAEGAAPWVRADQVPAFDMVFSIAGGPAVEAFRTRWGAGEALALYEAIDPAVFHRRSPDTELACDLALVADRNAASEATFDTYLLETARALPNHRFLVSGRGWEGAGSWPDNLMLVPAGNADLRATIYSSARAVLVPIGAHAIDHAMPIELLEPAACTSACVVVDRPGLAGLFRPNEEIFVPERVADLAPFLTTYGDDAMQRLGNRAAKRVILEYGKLPTATKFEQRVARRFYRGTNG